MKDLGWISIHRQLKNHWLWKDAFKLRCWIDILFSVNTAPAKVNIGNEIFECGRGESVRSLQSWAEQFGASKDFTRNLFKLLEKEHMIKRVNLRKTTRITVCNYDSYQEGLRVNQTQPKRAAYTNNKDNNISNNTPLASGGEEGNFQSFGIALLPEQLPKPTQYENFLATFNKEAGRSFKTLDAKAKSNFDKLKKQGYQRPDFIKAIRAGFKDSKQWTTPGNFTPEYITREANFLKYLNWETAETARSEPKPIYTKNLAEQEALFGDVRNPTPAPVL